MSTIFYVFILTNQKICLRPLCYLCKLQQHLKKIEWEKKTGRKLAQENILLQYYVAVEVDFPERGF